MFGGPEGVVVLILVLVLFGGSQLPKLARNLGRAQKEFKDGLAEASVPSGGPTTSTDPVITTDSPAAPADHSPG